MVNPMIRKLEVAGHFTDADRAVLAGMSASTQRVEAGTDVISHGDPPNDVHLVLSGIAHRYKLLPNGRRQIVAMLVPGDFCDLHVAILGHMDHSIAALTDCTVMHIPRKTVVALTEEHPRIARALWWATLVDEGVLREWLINLGRREAPGRMAHFFCELLLRLQAVGLADENSYDMPLRQNHLADALALTDVHINRTLQNLRGKGLVVLERRRLTIPNVDRLMAFCAFDATYLHLKPRADRLPTEQRAPEVWRD